MRADTNGDSMQFTLESNTENYIIRAYAPGEVIVTPPKDLAEKTELIEDPRFGDQPIALEILTSSFFIMPRVLNKEYSPKQYSDLSANEFVGISEYEPEIVLLGSGNSLQWPAKGVRESLLEKNIGVEVMDSGAACRTYNILMAEQRHVAALIFI